MSSSLVWKVIVAEVRVASARGRIWTWVEEVRLVGHFIDKYMERWKGWSEYGKLAYVSSVDDDVRAVVGTWPREGQGIAEGEKPGEGGDELNEAHCVDNGFD